MPRSPHQKRRPSKFSSIHVYHSLVKSATDARGSSAAQSDRPMAKAFRVRNRARLFRNARSNQIKVSPSACGNMVVTRSRKHEIVLCNMKGRSKVFEYAQPYFLAMSEAEQRFRFEHHGHCARVFYRGGLVYFRFVSRIF